MPQDEEALKSITHIFNPTERRAVVESVIKENIKYVATFYKSFIRSMQTPGAL